MGHSQKNGGGVALHTRPSTPDKTGKIPKTFHWCRAKYHYVTSFEDGGETQHVVKCFNKYKRRWHYEVWSDYIFRYTLELIHKRKLD